MYEEYNQKDVLEKFVEDYFPQEGNTKKIDKNLIFNTFKMPALVGSALFICRNTIKSLFNYGATTVSDLSRSPLWETSIPGLEGVEGFDAMVGLGASGVVLVLGVKIAVFIIQQVVPKEIQEKYAYLATIFRFIIAVGGIILILKMGDNVLVNGIRGGK